MAGQAVHVPQYHFAYSVACDCFEVNVQARLLLLSVAILQLVVTTLVDPAINCPDGTLPSPFTVTHKTVCRPTRPSKLHVVVSCTLDVVVSCTLDVVISCTLDVVICNVAVATHAFIHPLKMGTSNWYQLSVAPVVISNSSCTSVVAAQRVAFGPTHRSCDFATLFASSQ